MTTKILLSPSESSLSEKLGSDAITSPLPEQKGADILIFSKHGLIGLQRKEVPNDFISSFTDGRMSRSTSLLTGSCRFTRLIAEGKFKFFPDQRLVTGKIDPKTKRPEPSRFTRKHIRGMIFDIEFIRGIMIDWTDDIDDTVDYIRGLVDFVTKGKHLGLYSRPSVKGAWYVPSASEVQLWLLQGFQGVGPQLAENIIQHFGGRMPIAWTCTLDELKSVPRLTSKRAEEMWGLLGETVPAKDFTSRLAEIRKKLG